MQTRSPTTSTPVTAPPVLQRRPLFSTRPFAPPSAQVAPAPQEAPAPGTPEAGYHFADIPVRGARSPLPPPAVPRAMSDTAGLAAPGPASPLPRVARPTPTGLPDRLKAGIEALSGYDLSDVRVHSSSSQPAQLQALAYTQGTDIHVAPGQEKHLAHEAWHVVQQKQGRVRPTLQAQGVAINADDGLEREADRMGLRAAAHQGAVQARLATVAHARDTQRAVSTVANPGPHVAPGPHNSASQRAGRGTTLQRTLNKQTPLGKEKKATKFYPNAREERLAKNTELKRDEQRHQEGNLQYFTTAIKKQFKVTRSHEGLMRGGQSLPAGVYGYIVSPKGGLYAISETDSTDQQLLRTFGSSAFNHSLIRAGEPVQSAGEFYTNGPQITYINCSSGHYEPTWAQHVETVQGLLAAGFVTDQVRLGYTVRYGHDNLDKVPTLAYCREHTIGVYPFGYGEASVKERSPARENLDDAVADDDAWRRRFSAKPTFHGYGAYSTTSTFNH